MPTVMLLYAYNGHAVAKTLLRNETPSSTYKAAVAIGFGTLCDSVHGVHDKMPSSSSNYTVRAVDAVKAIALSSQFGFSTTASQPSAKETQGAGLWRVWS
jgi:hypothetical protein